MPELASKRADAVRRARRRLLAGAGLLAARPAAARAQQPAGAADLAGRFIPVPANEATPPPLDLADLGGRRHDLAAYRGRVVLVNFWATWCAPCLAEMPSLQLLQTRLEDAPFTVLAVNYGESAEKVAKYVETMAFDLPVLLDAFHRVRYEWKVRSLPTSYLIDASGRRRYLLRGECDWASPEAVAQVRALLPRT